MLNDASSAEQKVTRLMVKWLPFGACYSLSDQKRVAPLCEELAEENGLTGADEWCIRTAEKRLGLAR